MNINPTLSIIIVNYNTAKITTSCLKSVNQDVELKNGNIPFEIILVDNASTDSSLFEISKLKLPNLKIIKNKKNLGYAQANNQALAKSSGQYILLLNSDTLIVNSAISQCLNWLSTHPEAASCSPQLQNSDGSIQATGGYFPTIINTLSWLSHLDDLPFYNNFVKPIHPHVPSFYTKDSFYNKNQRLDWLTGAFVLTRKTLLKSIGGFDSTYFMYAEELEMFYRLKLTYPNLINQYLAESRIIHYGGASGNNQKYKLEKEGILRFFTKHHPKQALFIKPILKLC